MKLYCLYKNTNRLLIYKITFYLICVVNNLNIPGLKSSSFNNESLLKKLASLTSVECGKLVFLF